MFDFGLAKVTGFCCDPSEITTMHRSFLPFLFALAFTPAIAQADSEHVSLQGTFDNGAAFSMSFEAPNFTINPSVTTQSVPLENLTLSLKGQVVQEPVSVDALFGTNLIMSHPGWAAGIAAFNTPFIGENASGTQGQFLPGTYSAFGYVQSNGVYDRFSHQNTTLTVGAVPEPSAWGLVLVGGLCVVGFHLRRGVHGGITRRTAGKRA